MISLAALKTLRSSSSSSSAIDSRAGQIFSPVDATKPAVRQRSSAEPHSLVVRSAPCGHVSRKEGRGLGFGQLVHTHTGKCLKCQSSSDGHSDHSAMCEGGRYWSAGPAPVSELGQGVPGVHRFLSSTFHCTESGEVSWPLCR